MAQPSILTLVAIMMEPGVNFSSNSIMLRMKMDGVKLHASKPDISSLGPNTIHSAGVEAQHPVTPSIPTTQ